MTTIETVKVMSKVAQKLSLAKIEVANALKESDPVNYMKIRELLHDCQEIMAIHCNTAPIKLISGRLDEIESI